MDNQNKLDIYREIEKQLKDRKNKNERFYTDSSITIWVDHSHHCLYVDWTGYQSEETIMNGGQKMLEAVKAFKIQKVLNDNTHVVGIWTPAAKWTGEVWFPQMVEAGLKHFAWVISPNRLSQVSIEEALKNTEERSFIRQFDAIEDARKWLGEQG